MFIKKAFSAFLHLFFHFWTTWYEPKGWKGQEGNIFYTQSRKCKYCNKVQERIID